MKVCPRSWCGFPLTQHTWEGLALYSPVVTTAMRPRVTQACFIAERAP